jgi:hypothetical protein
LGVGSCGVSSHGIGRQQGISNHTGQLFGIGIRKVDIGTNNGIIKLVIVSFGDTLIPGEFFDRDFTGRKPGMSDIVIGVL